MDDARVIHETTPIQSEAAGESSEDAAVSSKSPAGVRDTLVLTYRAGGFQEPAAAGG
jgi:hypothetical protein